MKQGKRHRFRFCALFLKLCNIVQIGARALFHGEIHVWRESLRDSRGYCPWGRNNGMTIGRVKGRFCASADVCGCDRRSG